MYSTGQYLVLACLILLLPTNLLAAPVIPGLSGKHPLNQSQVGELLIAELQCTACHTRPAPAWKQDRPAPLLTSVGARVAPDYLQRYIANPESVHPGSLMPDLLADQSAEDRARIAEAITHYLVSLSTVPFDATTPAADDAKLGQSLFHSVGCVTCHATRDDQGRELDKSGMVSQRHVASKYSHRSLSEFLYQPHRVRPSGRMPDMKLTPAEAQAIASYLLGGSKSNRKPLQPNEQLVEQGKNYFEKFSCTSCHQIGEKPTASKLAPLGTDLKKGCLSKESGRGPRYRLDDEQIQAIQAAVAAKAEPYTEKTQVAMVLTTFNCISCHSRDNYGGVSLELDSYFKSHEKELGDEGRIPPPLTLVGAKLQKLTLKKVLYDGDGVRHYMQTRMPLFGEPNLRQLPELFAKLDKVKPVEFALPDPVRTSKQDRDREKVMRSAGRELIGDKGLGCIACHSFNGKVPNKNGIDLMTSTQRLQPSWFYHFLQDPNAFRARVVMPTSWPKGEAMHKGILNGDTDRQIEAIWYYLSLGTSAQDPSGIQRTDTILSVTEQARTYRGRSSVAGYRGIAVGFPQKWNYAFNAETGTLSAIWRGPFISVNWGGQGSGNFQPASRFLSLAQDVSFYQLPKADSPWPLRPVMTKDAPVNPDPLYPKNLGYQFKGYELDNAEIPSFFYKSGDVLITDRSEPQGEGPSQRLVRGLTFESPQVTTIWFRALTGAIERESATQFKVNGLRLVVPEGSAILRTTSREKASELLLKFDIPKGSSKKTITYELLP